MADTERMQILNILINASSVLSLALYETEVQQLLYMPKFLIFKTFYVVK
jgi:hypothetical protein